ncbi:MAG: hypothetical protein C4308_06285 [Chitinophagaceae bacterium]
MMRFAQNKFLVLLVAFLLLANIGLMLYFFVVKPHRVHDHRSEGRSVSEYVQKELGFSDEQTAKFKELRDQHREAIKPVMKELQQLKDSLYNQLNKPTPDSLVESIVTSIGRKQMEWEKMIFQHFQRVRAICNESQLPKFDSLVHRMINRGPWMKRNGLPIRKNKESQ